VETINRSAYEILNVETSKMRASLETTFVYLLIFNTNSATELKPFFIGYTDNLSRRFSNHAQIIWHNKIIGTPTKIWIAGSIEKSKAHNATENLIHRLLMEGHILRNSQSNGFHNKTQEEIINYINNPLIDNISVSDWATFWGVKTETGKKNKAVNPVIPQANTITHEQIINYINSLSDLSNESKELALKIADNYDYQTGLTSYIFQRTERSAWNKIGHIWFSEKKHFKAPVVLRLTKNCIAKLLPNNY
jgi:hypothetical protein